MINNSSSATIVSVPPKKESVLCAWPCLECLERGIITPYLINEDKDFRGTIIGTVAQKGNHIFCGCQGGPREDPGCGALSLTGSSLSFHLSQPASTDLGTAEWESNELPEVRANQEFMEDFIAISN